MKRLFVFASLAAMAIGCGQQSANDSPVSSDSTSAPQISRESAQSDDALAAANTTLVSLKVPGMT